MDNVPDFIILRSLYDRSVSHRYHPGSRIETILDNHWWTGTIDKKEAEDEENYPRFSLFAHFFAEIFNMPFSSGSHINFRSNWYCIIVKWDTGEDERMSPWDVDPQQPGRRSGIYLVHFFCISLTLLQVSLFLFLIFHLIFYYRYSVLLSKF